MCRRTHRGRRCEQAETANKRMGGRAVEGTGLENRQGRKSLVGSNPTPSAIDVDVIDTSTRFLPFRTSLASRKPGASRAVDLHFLFSTTPLFGGTVAATLPDAIF